MMRRCISLIFQPRATNSPASQSSNSGCVGGSPSLPNSLGVGTMPRPKWCCQRRLTITRAVSGFAGSVSHLASAARTQVHFRRRALLALVGTVEDRLAVDQEPCPFGAFQVESVLAVLEDFQFAFEHQADGFGARGRGEREVIVGNRPFGLRQERIE